MPVILKWIISIVGILFILATKSEIKDPNVFDIITMITFYLVGVSMIFFPWK